MLKLQNSNLESPLNPNSIMHRTSISAEDLHESLIDHANENSREKEPLLNAQISERKLLIYSCQQFYYPYIYKSYIYHLVEKQENITKEQTGPNYITILSESPKGSRWDKWQICFSIEVSISAFCCYSILE